MKKNIYRLLAAALAAAAVTVSVTACGSGSGVNTASEYIMETTAAAYNAKSAMAPQMMTADTGAADGAAAYDEAYAAAGETASFRDTGAGLTSETPMEQVSSNRKLIRNVTLHLETTGFDELLQSVRQTVNSFGGYIEQSDVSGTSISSDYSNQRYAYLCVRVPSDKMDGFLNQVGEQANVTNRSENIQDVTLQYTDIESRKKSLTIEQERLWDLLEKADSLDGVIALESRLSEIRYQLESMESQLRTYDNLVDYSTVFLNIDEVKVFTATNPSSIAERIQKGFQQNLSDVKNLLINFFVWFISALPILAVLAIIIAIIVGIVKILLKADRHRPDRQKKNKKTGARPLKSQAQNPQTENTEHLNGHPAEYSMKQQSAKQQPDEQSPAKQQSDEQPEEQLREQQNQEQ